MALGPAHVAQAAPGTSSLSLVEGVQQLEVYFGQYLPQLFVSGLTPLLIFGAVALLDLPHRADHAGRRALHAHRPVLWHRRDAAGSLARSQAYATLGAELLDAIQGLGTLKAFGQSRAWGERLAAKSQRGSSRAPCGCSAPIRWRAGSPTWGWPQGRRRRSPGARYRVRDGELGLPALLVVLMLGVEVFRPLRELRSLLHQGMLGRAAAESVFALLALRPEVPDSAASSTAPRGSPTVAFGAVHFRYPGGRRAALDGLTFDVAAGERVGIVGPSGAGKSTLVRLLLRFHDPQGGAVRLGGRDLRTLAPDEVRGHIAVVSQDTYLFHGTVEENLRLGKPDASRAELEAAARAANAHEFIRAPAPGLCARVVGERAGAAVGRPAPAHRHRAGASPRRAHPGARRGALLGGRGE